MPHAAPSPRKPRPGAVCLGSVVVLMLAALTACAPSRLIVDARPEPAHVSVTDARGKLVAQGPAPLSVPVNFIPPTGEHPLTDADAQTGPRYSVEVEATGDHAQRYLPKSVTLTPVDFAALPEADDAKPGSNTRQLDVSLDERQYVNLAYVEVALTPEARWVGVVTTSRAYKDITEAGGAVPALIADLGANLGIQGMTLSPDGQRIVYAEASYAQPVSDLDRLASAGKRAIDVARANLRGIRIDGGGVQHITTEDFLDMYPAFTPDGEGILFSSNRRRAGYADILKIRAASRAGIANVYTAHRPALALRPSQALDGTLAFALHHVDPTNGRITDQQVWTLGGPNQYPTQIARGSQPAISSDGRMIAYIGPDRNLWVCAADGSNQTQLTFNAKGILARYEQSLTGLEKARYEANRAAGLRPIKPYSYPTWSDDGKMILYTSMEGADPTGRPNEDIWAMTADGASKQQLTTNGSADRYPLMSADMQNVYFLSNRGQRWAIWRIPAPLDLK